MSTENLSKIANKSKGTLKREIASTNTKEASFVLRGIAILAVLINHYVDHYMTLESGGIANIMVSIFFILSGYGISFSLDKRLADGLKLRQILEFYKDRALKIFPLLWIALIIQSAITRDSYSIYSILGYELRNHYWFVSAILQCYLLSPFLNRLIKFNIKISLILSTLVLVACEFLVHRYPSLSSFLMVFHLAETPYLQILFVHTYLFSCGMHLRYILNFEIGRIFSERAFFLQSTSLNRNDIFVMILAFALTYTTIEKHILTGLPLAGSLFLFSCVCIFALKSGISSNGVLGRICRFLGYHSFSLYLFHMSYYFSLEKIGLLKEDSTASMLIAIGLFPAFVVAVLCLEKVSEAISICFGRLLGYMFQI
ncbi:MAG: acyltransferase [Cyanobacteria bacterium P01_F01_bin.86]